MKVQLCSRPELYPIEILDILKLRKYGLIGVREFERKMRELGITRALAYVLLGCYERGEVTVITDKGEEISGEEVEKLMSVKVYYFRWHVKVKYTQRKHHEIHIDLTVAGTVEKHGTIPKPSEDEIRDEIDHQLDLAFEKYLKDFWHIRKLDLEFVYDADIETAIEDFYVKETILKKQNEPLEYNVDYIDFFLSREEHAPFVRRDDLAKDFEPYVEEALANVIDFIYEEEMNYLRKVAEEIAKAIREYVEKTREEAFRRRLKRMIEASKNITDLETVRTKLDNLLKRGEINEDLYNELYEELLRKARSILMEQVKKWCDRLRKAQSTSELNEILRRIMRTKTWKSPLFQELKQYVLECARKRANELLKEEREKEKLPKEEVMKRAYRYFLNQFEEIVKRPITDPTIVRDLWDLLSRVRRSNLPDKMKEELEDKILKKIEEISEKKCEHFRKLIEKANKLGELRSIRATLRRQKREIEKCYDELMEMIEDKINQLREEVYRKTEEKIEKQVEKAKDYERADVILKNAENILRLPVDKQFKLFVKLIDEAKSIPELQAIMSIFSASPIATNPKYYELKVQIEARYRDKLWRLGGRL